MIGFSHFFLMLLPTVNLSLGSKHSYANELISSYSVHMKIEVNVICCLHADLKCPRQEKLFIL